VHTIWRHAPVVHVASAVHGEPNAPGDGSGYRQPSEAHVIGVGQSESCEHGCEQK
jgi:hypothetical protein